MVYSSGYSRGIKFSTKDDDNDAYDNSCTVQYSGAWWCHRCSQSHLNVNRNRSRGHFFFYQEHGGMAGVHKPTSMACTIYITRTSTGQSNF